MPASGHYLKAVLFMPGPQPKPVKLKALRGEKNADSMRNIEFDTKNRDDCISPPPHLKGEAFAEWCRIAGPLYDIGVLTPIDRTYLSLYCESLGVYHDAMRDVEQYGITIHGANGGLVKNPAYQVARDSSDSMLKYGSRFGLSPADRARLQLPEAEQVNPAEAAALKLLS